MKKMGNDKAHVLARLTLFLDHFNQHGHYTYKSQPLTYI